MLANTLEHMFDSTGTPTAWERAHAALQSVERRVGVEHHDLVVTLAPPEPDLLTELLPDGDLPTGAAVTVRDSASLMCWLLGATQRDKWMALVGWPELSPVALAEAGVDLERVVVVPDVGGRAAAILAALLDGIEIVVAGPHAATTMSDVASSWPGRASAPQRSCRRQPGRARRWCSAPSRAGGAARTTVTTACARRTCPWSASRGPTALAHASRSPATAPPHRPHSPRGPQPVAGRGNRGVRRHGPDQRLIHGRRRRPSYEGLLLLDPLAVLVRLRWPDYAIRVPGHANGWTRHSSS